MLNNIPPKFVYNNKNFYLEFATDLDAFYYAVDQGNSNLVLRVNIVKDRFEVYKCGKSAIAYTNKIMNLIMKRKKKAIVFNKVLKLLCEHYSHCAI